MAGTYSHKMTTIQRQDFRDAPPFGNGHNHGVYKVQPHVRVLGKKLYNALQVLFGNGLKLYIADGQFIDETPHCQMSKPRIQQITNLR